MILINILLVLLIFLILSDLYIKNSSKSKLNLKPINYKIKKKDGINELIIDLKITNTSKTKETMVSNIYFELDFFKSKGNEYCRNLNYQEDIYLIEDDEIKNLNNYWPTTIIKTNSELFVRIIYKFSNNNFREKIKYLWLKVFRENYGHFGISKNKDCLLINLDGLKQRPKEVSEIPINNKYIAFAIKTDLLGCFDDPVNTVIEYCKGIVEKNDILTIGESPLAIMQNRYIAPQNLEYSLFSKALCYFFHPTSSLATACGMQLLINKIGVTRITFALIFGFIFKLFGIKGIFYRLTGSESSLIDDISGTVKPYDKSIVMGPLNADLFCKEVSKYLNIDVAVVDVNDLGGVKVLASSNKKINKILKRNLISNPAGNGDEKTPIVLIREKK
jgi:biopolymer transport protein ExbD